MAQEGMAQEGKVAVVTGAGTGIGRATCLRLAERGWRVVVNYSRSEAEAKDTAAACERLGAEAMAYQANVAEDSECRGLAEAALARWGRIDGLVNNAGITKVAAGHDLDALSADDFHDIYAINVVGAYQMTRAVAPAMKRGGKGSIVNVSSIVGLVGGGSSTAYAASKGALNTLTLALARGLAPEIRVNALCPSFVETRWVTGKMSAEAYTNAKAAVEEAAPLRRICMPEDVAEAAVWFLEGGELITGEILVIDGGIHLFSLGAAYRPAR